MGDRRISQGTLATDKQFTGQRLDSTGLYYYNARYYDPDIGRFISPDTVVQSLYDPQSLNRDSYCLNNPLRYTDPTGDVVNFQNEDLAMMYLESGVDIPMNSELGQMIQDWASLRNAYSDLMNDPNAGAIATELYNDPNKIISIGFGTPNGGAGGQTLPTNVAKASLEALAGVGSAIDWTITISSGFSGTPGLTPLLAHELYHAHDSTLSDSVQEEVRAYQLEDKVADRLNPLPNGLQNNTLGLRSIDSTNISQLQVAYRALNANGKDSPPFYKTLPLLPASNGLVDVSYGACEVAGVNPDAVGRIFRFILSLR